MSSVAGLPDGTMVWAVSGLVVLIPVRVLSWWFWTAYVHIISFPRLTVLDIRSNASLTGLPCHDDLVNAQYRPDGIGGQINSRQLGVQ